MLTSIAVVTTDASARYAKQLLAHLGRKVMVEPLVDESPPVDSTTGDSTISDPSGPESVGTAPRFGRNKIVADSGQAGSALGAQAGRLMFAYGVGTVIPLPGRLTLRATAANLESLGRVQDVVQRHLERFGARRELVVTWGPVDELPDPEPNVEVPVEPTDPEA